MLQIMDHEKKYFTNNLLGIGFSVAGCALPLMRTALQTIRLPIQIVNPDIDFGTHLWRSGYRGIV
jgi:hypothetical protein